MEAMGSAAIKQTSRKTSTQRSPEETTARRGTLLIAYGHTTVDFSQGAMVKSDGVVFLPFVETSSVMASGTGTCLVL